MGFMDLCVYVIIAVCYNLFIHQVTSMLYKDCTYDEKYKKSLTFLFIAGLAAIIVAKSSIKKQIVSIGLTLGGAILILTSIIVNWKNMTDEIKLCMSAVGFGIVIWYFYFYYDKPVNKNTINKLIKSPKLTKGQKKQEQDIDDNTEDNEEILNMEL